MDYASQIQQAVEILASGTNDESLKNNVLNFVNELKSSPDGWNHCIELLVKNDAISDNVKFFIFQILSEKISTLNSNDLIKLKDSIFGYLTNLVSQNKIEPVYLKNGLSKVIGLLFVYATLSCYPAILKDLLKLTKINNNNDYNDLATDYYLRTLLVIHSEIGDHLILRDRNTVERNNLLKDSIRANDMIDITNSWKEILQLYSTTKSDSPLSQEILNSTIENIGSYVSWIEINLILEENFVALLYNFLNTSNEKQKITTINTFTEILHKKMQPMKKLELINFLNLSSILNQLDFKSNGASSSNLDVNIAFSKLVDTLGSQLVSILDKSSNEELSNIEFKNLTVSKLLETFPLIFQFLENEYDDVSQEIFTFIGEFLLFLKKNITNDTIDFSALNNDEILTTLLKKILLKMRYDNDDDGDDEEDVEQFNEIRNKLNSFHDSIFIINETLALDVMIECINESLFNSTDNNWRSIELGLYELNHYSEVLRNNLMNLPKTMINNSKPYFVFHEMLCKIIDNSTSILISHPLIQLLFFELILKHYSFFSNNNIQVENVNKTDILLKVLKIFISNFGLFSDNEKVKFRSWFLFNRFIKLAKPNLDDFVFQELIQNLLPLLSINFELKNSSNVQLSKDIDLSTIEDTTFQNQLYLFESIGLFISIIKKQELRIEVLQSVFQPLFTTLGSCINNISNISLNLLIQVHHSLVAIGTLLKGFESLSSNEFDGKFLEIFEQISQVVLITLENFIQFNIVRESSQFCIVRLFILLIKLPSSSAIESILEKFISLVMINFNLLKMEEINNFIHFLSQINHYCNNIQNIYLMLNSLLSPLSTKILDRIETTSKTAQDDFTRREVIDLQKSFISFLLGISNDHLNSIWLTQENKELLVTIINTMLNYSINSLHDPQLMKIALGELGSLIDGLGTGRVVDNQDIFRNDSFVFENAQDILINNSILVCIDLSFKNDKVDIKDAQFRNNVLLEVCRLLRSIAFIGCQSPEAISQRLQNKLKPEDIKANEETCNNINQLLINNLNFPADLSRNFIQALVTSNDRQFLKHLTPLITSYRGN